MSWRQNNPNHTFQKWRSGMIEKNKNVRPKKHPESFPVTPKKTSATTLDENGKKQQHLNSDRNQKSPAPRLPLKERPSMKNHPILKTAPVQEKDNDIEMIISEDMERKHKMVDLITVESLQNTKKLKMSTEGQLQKEIAQLRQEKESAIDNVKIKASTIVKLRSDITNLEAEISTTNEKNAKLERKISKLEANAKDLESKLSESENVKNELMKRVDAEKRRFLQNAEIITKKMDDHISKIEKAAESKNLELTNQLAEANAANEELIQTINVNEVINQNFSNQISKLNAKVAWLESTASKLQKNSAQMDLDYSSEKARLEKTINDQAQTNYEIKQANVELTRQLELAKSKIFDYEQAGQKLVQNNEFLVYQNSELNKKLSAISQFLSLNQPQVVNCNNLYYTNQQFNAASNQRRQSIPRLEGPFNLQQPNTSNSYGFPTQQAMPNPSHSRM